jgi:hypothetical protein
VVDAAPARRAEASPPRRRPGPSAVPHPTTVPAAEMFVPILVSDSLSDLDRGEVVRVGLPRLALVSWGWPLDGDVALETVEADVIVGEDGLARAIRLVHPNSSNLEAGGPR